jgi:prophage tail gpP-like protein
MVMADLLWIDVEDRDDASVWHTVDKFQQYEVIQNLWGEAGTFKLQPTPTADIRKIFLSGEQRVRIMCNDAMQFTGVTDDRESGHAVGGSYLDLTGRDMGRWLIDVGFSEGKSVSGWTLKKLADYASEPWRPDYISEVVTDDAPAHYVMAAKQRSRYRQITTSEGLTKRVRVKGSQQKAGKKSPYYRGVDVDELRQMRVEPGSSRWEKIREVARQVACIAYVTAQGELFIGRPSYDRVEYDDLVYSPKGGNVLAADWRPATGDRYASYTVIAQGRKKRSHKGRSNNRSIEVRDPSPAFWLTKSDGSLEARVHKPQTLRVPRGCHNDKLLRRLARTTVEEIACRSYRYEVELAGHERDGLLWAPNACVNVTDEWNDISGQHYIVERRFVKSVDAGTRTVLSLIPAKIWLHLDHDDVTDDEWDEWIKSRVTW